MLEDMILIWKLKRADKGALRRIFEKYKAVLLTVAVGLLNDAAAGEDVLHDVFVSFAADIKNFRIQGSLKDYLVRRTVIGARDRLNSRMYKVVGLESTGPLGSDGGEPEEKSLPGERNRIVTGALSKLPLQQREAVVLHLQGQMGFRQIAGMQAVSVNTVKGRYLYGLERLRSLLSGELAG